MVIELSDDEALVLFELLHDYGTRDEGRSLSIRHPAERNALWALECALEKQLVAPFQEDYDRQLQGARERVEAKGGSW